MQCVQLIIMTYIFANLPGWPVGYTDDLDSRRRGGSHIGQNRQESHAHHQPEIPGYAK